MASAAEVRRSPFSADPQAPNLHKSIPILPSSSAAPSLTPPGDPMEVTPSSSAPMGPPIICSPSGERSSANQPPLAAEQLLQPHQPQQAQPQQQQQQQQQHQESDTNGSSAPTTNGQAIGAAAAAQQPKVVQTAFIHKLYNMLEDQSIQHLISWSNTNESFVMSPSSEFSKVLSSYFKHTNISSFVRQLNMYGFHKVSDVFHTGSPDSPLWEFKHGNGSFKRGDLVSLREIKRRTSRHALIHRDSFSTGPKVNSNQAGAPVEPMPDPVEARLGILEHHLYEMHVRLARSEDNVAYMNSKYQALSEGLMRCHQWNHDLSRYITALVHDPDNPIHRDVSMMQTEIQRQIELLRGSDDNQDPLQAGRPPFFQNLATDNPAPVSPRQMPQNDQRRPSLANNFTTAPFRPPPHLSTISPRRHGSIGGPGSYSPSSARPPTQQAPPPPPPAQLQHPLVSLHSPPMNLSRRHTAADIRSHGWQANQSHGQSPYASGHSSTQWPSSPHRAPINQGDQQLQQALAQYEIRNSRQPHSRQATPPPDVQVSGSASLGPDWAQLPGARPPYKGIDTPGPPTRRSSMASNVHSLLNPAETAERPDEDDCVPPESMKRKRLQ